MRTFFACFALLFIALSSSSFALEISQVKLKKLYSQEDPQKRDTALLQSLADNLSPQINSSLPDSLKRQVVAQTLNAWRGNSYTPTIVITGASRELVENSSLLRELLSAVDRVKSVWPKQNTWKDVVVEIYFNQLYANDPQQLAEALPGPYYEVTVKETMTAEGGDNNYVYRLCVCVTIKTDQQ